MTIITGDKYFNHSHPMAARKHLLWLSASAICFTSLSALLTRSDMEGSSKHRQNNAGKVGRDRWGEGDGEGGWAHQGTREEIKKMRRFNYFQIQANCVISHQEPLFAC